MNIDDLEKNMSEGSFNLDFKKVINELLTLSIHNNALLRVSMVNQARIMKQLNPEIDQEQFEQDCIDTAIAEAKVTHAKLILKLAI
jgi:hypothetical protein